MAALEASGRVARLLSDQSLRQRIEQVLSARVQDPDGAMRRALQDREVFERRAASRRRSSNAQNDGMPPQVAQAAIDTPPHGPATLQGLHLVANASFELLLSLQRTLQQDLSAALDTARSGNDTPAGATVATSDVRPFTRAPARPGGGAGLGTCVVCLGAEVNTVFYRCGQCASAERTRQPVACGTAR